MTQTEIYHLLNSGALIRLPSGKVRVWKGPFQALESVKKSEFSIAWMDFFGAQTQFLQSVSPVEEMEVSTLRRMLQPLITETPLSSSNFFQPSFEKFQESFQEIQGKIHRGEIEKAVPVVFAESPVVPSLSQRAQMLNHALEAHSELNVFGFWDEKSGIIGGTPEVLFHLKDHSLKTMALAGTYPRALAQGLLEDPKELREHQIVVEDITQRLEKWGYVRVGQTHVAEFGTIAHLRTLIEAEVTVESAEDMMKLLHPTAALGVFPRNYGLAWMKNLPYQDQRGVFGAPILFSLSPTETLALVAIRCLQWNENGAQIGTGCGIVEASDLQKEWKELALKRESVMKVLGLSL